MTPMVQMDAEEIKRFIHSRLMSRPNFPPVIAVSVERYPQEFFVRVWIAEEPSPEVRQYGYELESELSGLGIPCSIIIKADRELPFGGTHGLRTKKGEFTYRYYRIDPAGDEDEVYAFTVFRGSETYRFRMSLTGTLASMLRNRGRLSEERVLGVYNDWIRQKLDADDTVADEVQKRMFDSRDVALFVAA